MLDELTPSGPVNPARIRSARMLRGLTQQEVTESMPASTRISPAALSQLESGRTSPSERTLRGLARALDVPEAFLRARWHEEGERAGSNPVFFRHLRSTPKRERLRAEAHAALVFDLLAAVDQDVRLPRIDLPDAEVDAESSFDEIVEAAEVVRDAWGLGDGPIDNVVRTIERRGVPVTRVSFGDTRIDAFSVAYGRRPLIVLTDDKGGYARSRFDAAHELGHLVMHRDTESGSKSVEQQAQSFAAEFLMPTAAAHDVLPRRLDNSGWRELASLKREWGMSLAALLFRARDVEAISPNTYTNAMKMMSAKGWRRLEPGDRELGAPERPVLLRRAVEKAAEEWDLEVEQFLEASGLPTDDCLSLLGRSRPSIEL